MKNKIAVLVVIFAGLIIIPGCRKYPDGSLFSVHTRTERVANTWRVDNYKINGNDYTSLVSNYSETYTKAGDFFNRSVGVSGTGKWAFQNHDNEIRITGINHLSSKTLYILKLEEKQFWYYYMDGNDKNEFHMVQL